MNECAFGEGCGRSVHYTNDGSFLYHIYECNKDTLSHLTRLGATDSTCNSCNLPEGILILYRSGLFNIDAETLNLCICQRHRDDLGIYWRRLQRSCQSPLHIEGSKCKVDRGIKPQWCKEIWLNQRKCIQIGAGICTSCRKKSGSLYKCSSNSLQKDINNFIAFVPSQAVQNPREVENKANPDHQQNEEIECSQERDLSSQSTVISHSDWEQDVMSSKEKFNRAMSILSDRSFPLLNHQLRMPWEDLSKSSKSFYLKIVTEAFQLITDHVTPGQSRPVLKSALNRILSESESECTSPDIMTKTLIQAYLQQNDRSTQTQILSLFASKFSKKQLMELIPGLTVFRIDAARRHAAVTSPGQLINPPKVFRTRLKMPKLIHFIEFISSPIYHQAVGYGSKSLKLSTGIEIKVPKIVRNVIASRLIATYMSYCADTGFSCFGRATLFSIVKVCVASQKKNMFGLDNITSEGMRGMETMLKVVGKLEMFGLSTDKVEQLKHVLSHANQHLKFEMKSHIQNSSSCIDHCSTYSLSDSRNPAYRGHCDHSHDETCNDCSLVNKLEGEVTMAYDSIKDMIPVDIKEEISYDIKSASSNISAWKSHCIRSVHQEQARQDKLSQLKPNQALIVLDWAMKLIPIRHRETQADFFGKKGISWHVSCVIVLSDNEEISDIPTCTNTKFDVLTFVHILQNGTQGWFSVAHILKDLCHNIHCHLPAVTEVYMKSDNAGCYHSSSLISFIHHMNTESPVRILEYNFSEAQSGKDICDAKTSHCKMHILRYCAEGHDVISPSDVRDAIHSNNGVRGVLASVIEVDQQQEQKMRTKIPDISKLNNVTFVENGVFFRRAYGIGDGMLVTSSDFKDTSVLSGFKVLEPFPVLLRLKGRVTINPPLQDEQPPANDDHEEYTSTDNQLSEQNVPLFACPEQNCTKVYTKVHLLDAHIAKGHHVFSNTQNGFDIVKKMWVQKCISVEREHKFVIQSASNVTTSFLNEGWALKSTRTSKRFSSKVKEYLKEIFIDCETSGKRPNFEKLAEELKTIRSDSGLKLFPVDDWLTPPQIRSLFASFVQKKSASNQVTITQISDIKDEDLQHAVEDIEALEHHSGLLHLAQNVTSEIE